MNAPTLFSQVHSSPLSRPWMPSTTPVLSESEVRRSKRQRGVIVRRIKRLLDSGLETPRNTYSNTVIRFAGGANCILDIGCGYTAPDLEKLHVNSALKVGTDIVDGLCPAASPSVRFIQADCSRLPFYDAIFDLVICRSVFEHLEDPLATFCEVSRVLAPRGVFVFLTPNRWDYVSLAASFVPNRLHGKLVHKLTGRNEEDTFPTLYRANSIGRIRSLATHARLRVVQLQLLREHPHYLQFNSLAYAFGLAFEQSVQRFLKSLRPWILGILERGPDPCSEPS